MSEEKKKLVEADRAEVQAEKAVLDVKMDELKSSQAKNDANIKKQNQIIGTFKEDSAYYQQLLAQAEKEKRQAQKYKDEIERLRDEELKKAQTQAIRIVEQAKRSAAALTEELEKLKKENPNQKCLY